MKITEILTNLFCRKEKTPLDQVKKTIRKMGFKYEDEDNYVKKSSGGRTIITLMESGIRIKVYSSGYGESDFLSNPVTDHQKLKQFIRENELQEK